MITVVVVLILTAAALGFALWLVSAMLRHRCPTCTRQNDEGMLIPVIPGVRWWCLACGGIFTPAQTLAEGARAPETEESAPEPAAEPQVAPEPEQPAGGETPQAPRLDV